MMTTYCKVTNQISNSTTTCNTQQVCFQMFQCWVSSMKRTGSFSKSSLAKWRLIRHSAFTIQLVSRLVSSLNRAAVWLWRKQHKYGFNYFSSTIVRFCHGHMNILGYKDDDAPFTVEYPWISPAQLTKTIMRMHTICMFDCISFAIIKCNYRLQ